MVNELYHYGIKGQKWGIRRYQNEDGTYTALGKELRNSKKSPTLFVSGSSKTEFKDHKYYRKNLPKDVTDELDSAMRSKKKIILGDAPGIDRQVQKYLNKKKYNNVTVYSPGSKNRYLANPTWKVKFVDSKKYIEGSEEWLAEKDKAMLNVADEGLAVVIENGGSSATRKNVDLLISQNKNVKVYELSEIEDKWIK